MAILAAVSSVILIGGWWARPREVPQAPAPVPTETELEQLARRAERRTLDDMKQFFAGVAREAGSSIVSIPSAATSGIAWDTSRVVTAAHHLAWNGGAVRLIAATEIQAEPVTWGPNLPLSVLTIRRDAAALIPARRSEVMPATGDWIVAVWRTGTAPAYGVGNFRQASPITCGDVLVQEFISSLSLTTTMMGGSVFDLNGGLLAVILPCQERLAAVAATSIDAILQRSTSPGQQLEARYGLTVGLMSPEEQEYFKSTEGLLVRTVWTDYPADEAGIWPGDIVTAVKGQVVTTVSDLISGLGAADATREVTVQRGRKRLTIALAARGDATALGRSSGGGLVLETPPTTYPIKSVLPGSRAADAGLKPGDRLIRIDQAQPRGVAQVERGINADQPRPTWLELIRDRRRVGLLLR